MSNDVQTRAHLKIIESVQWILKPFFWIRNSNLKTHRASSMISEFDPVGWVLTNTLLLVDRMNQLFHTCVDQWGCLHKFSLSHIIFTFISSLFLRKFQALCVGLCSNEFVKLSFVLKRLRFAYKFSQEIWNSKHLIVQIDNLAFNKKSRMLLFRRTERSISRVLRNILYRDVLPPPNLRFQVLNLKRN